MRKTVAFILSLAIFTTTAFAEKMPVKNPPINIAHQFEETDNIVYDELMALENKNWINLTNEQMMEDYEYLNKTLKENFPFLGVAKRLGIDINDNYEKYKQDISNCKNDVEFWLSLTEYTNSFEGVGHLSLFDAKSYSSMSTLYKDIESRKTWHTELNNDLSKRNYALMEKTMAPAMEKIKEKIKNQNPKAYEEKPNVTTRIITQDKTAYININSFSNESMEKDEKILTNFYKKVANYDNLIIDISNNSGGSMSYYIDLIMYPNMSKPLATKNYIFFKNGENNKKYIDSSEYEPIENLPELEKMNKDDLNNLDYFSEANTSMQSEDNKYEPIFKGKIWLLVSGKVYSSSEAFANYCKESGFATIVGTQTGGDGIGMDPVFAILPNSGIIARYSSIYGTISDGANSQEFGTTPDIISKEGETPLQTCLKAINAEI